MEREREREEVNSSWSQYRRVSVYRERELAGRAGNERAAGASSMAYLAVVAWLKTKIGQRKMGTRAETIVQRRC